MWIPRGLEIRPPRVRVSQIRPCRETNRPHNLVPSDLLRWICHP